MRARRMMIGAMLVFAPGTFFAQSPAPKTSRIVGIVIDSLHQSGLEGAEVIVSGLASPVTTDSLGRFSVDSLAPGTYQVGVFHPLIESLGLTRAEVDRSVWAVESGGRRFEAAGAVNRVLGELGGGWRALGWLYRLPVIKQVEDAYYRRVAGRRAWW